MTQTKHYKQASKDLERADNIAEEMIRLGLMLGVKPGGLNPVNAQRAVSKAVEELVEARETANNNGYDSLGFALKALGQKTPEIQLPDWVQWAPAHWIVEASVETISYWKNGRRVDAPKRKSAVTALQAQKQLDRLKPTIKLVFDELDWKPEELDKVKKAFLTLTFADFQEALFGFLRSDGDENEDTEEVTTGQKDPELEARLEELKQSLGVEFDEDAARCLLATA